MIAKILASVGLPNTVAGKKEFYKRYPDEASYKMAMGGMPKAEFGNTGSTGVAQPYIQPINPNKVPANKFDINQTGYNPN